MFRRDTVTVDRQVWRELMDERKHLMRLLLLGGDAGAVNQDAALAAAERVAVVPAVVPSNLQPEPGNAIDDDAVLGTGYDYVRGGLGGEDEP